MNKDKVFLRIAPENYLLFLDFKEILVLFKKLKVIVFLGVLNFIVLPTLLAQITVSGGTLAIGNYSRLKTAIDSINTKPVTGNIIINVVANHIDTLTSKILLTATGTPTMSITIQKSGSGANPKLISYVGTNNIANSTADGFFILSGSDYITIDGLDLEERATNITPTTVMEFGYGLMKANGSNGCQYNTIKNCNISLNRIQNSASGFNGSTGIVLLNNSYTSTSSVSVSNKAGSHSYNVFYGNKIFNANNGFYLSGFADSGFPFLFSEDGFGDTENLIEGNEIKNYGGGGTNPSFGIYVLNQWSIICKNNTIINNDGNGINHAGSLRGIYLGSVSQGSVICKSNVLKLQSIATSGNYYGIESLAGNNGISNEVVIESNVIHISNEIAGGPTTIGINHNASVANLLIRHNHFDIISNSNASISAINLNGNIANNIKIDSNTIDTLRMMFTGVTSSNRRFINCTAGAASSNKSITGNIINTVLFDIAGNNSGEVSYIFNSGEGQNTIINKNTAVNHIIKTNGQVYLIYNSFSNTISGNRTVSENYFENISRTGTGSNGIICYNDNTSVNTTNYNLHSNVFRNINNGNASGGIIGFRIIGSGTSVVFDFFNNQLKQFTSQGLVNGINLNNVGGTQVQPSRIRNNIISKFNGVALNSSFISLSTSVSYCDVFENRLDSLTLNGNGNGFAFQLNSTAANVNFYKNRISEITNLHNNGSVIGLYITAGNLVNINNNLMANLKAVNSISLSAISGIYLAGADSVSVSHNTVFLNGNSSAASTFGTTALYVSNTINALINRNNIFSNISVPGNLGGFTSCINFQNNSAISDYSPESNHNLYYAGSPSVNRLISGEGSNANAINGKQYLQDYKAYLINRDYYSVTENVSFLSTDINSSNFLHINPSVQTEIESGGIPITGLTKDIDDEARSLIKPDIGADEGNFLPKDQSPPHIHPLTLLNACDSLAYSFDITITDYKSNVPISGTGLPVLWWKLSSAGAWATITSVYAGNNNYTFTIPQNESLINDTIFYYIIAQDQAVTPNVVAFPHTGISVYTANPPSSLTAPLELLHYKRIDTLNGVYTIGLGGDFPSITSAISAYTFYCIKGPIEFHLIDSLYTSVTEIMPFNITQSLYADASKPLLIRPADSTDVRIIGNSGSAGSGLLQISGADFITIDGSNEEGSSRNMTIKNTFSANAVSIKVVSFQTNPSENITIKNCKLRNASNSGFGIHAGGSAINTGGFGMKKLTVTNNQIDSVDTGISVFGANNDKADSLEISSNDLTYNTIHSANGISISNVKNTNVSKNEISINASETITGLGIGQGCEKLTIQQNKIVGLHSTGDSVTAISCLGGQINALVIQNNFIGNISGAGNLYGIYSNIPSSFPSSNFKIYHNTIKLEDTLNISSNIISSAIRISQNINNLDIRNNIFSNQLFNASNLGGNSKHYSIYSGGSPNQFDHLDYNIYSTSTDQGSLGFINNAIQVNLQAIQNSFGQNQSSIVFRPNFISLDDLHLNDTSNYDIDDKAISIATVDHDIDDSLRSILHPDIGADEFTTLPCNLTSGGEITPAADSICFGQTYTILTTNVTSQPHVKYLWQQSSDGIVFTNLTSGDTTRLYEVESLPVGIHYYRLRVLCNLTNDTSYSNVFTLTVNQLPSVSIEAEDTIFCRGTTLMIEANGGLTYEWTPIHSENEINASTLTVEYLISERYFVRAYDVNGCSDIDSIVVNVNDSPEIFSITADPSNICINDSTTLNTIVHNAYELDTTTYVLKDTTGFTRGPFGVDVSSGGINLPFDFTFYNQTYNQLYINTNGIVTFELPLMSLNNAQAIPEINSMNNFIALCWSNLVADAGDIKYGTIGAAPNRIFVIDYDDVNFINSAKRIAGQIQLYEDSDKIQLHIKIIDSLNIHKVIGIENQNGSRGLSPLHRNVETNFWNVTIPEAYEFKISTPSFSWVPTNAVVNAFSQNTLTFSLQENTTFHLTAMSNTCKDTDSVEVSVITTPTIVLQPLSAEVCLGNDITFVVEATGSDNITYQWYKDGLALMEQIDVRGIINDTLNLLDISLDDEANYTVEISDCNVTIESENANLNTLVLPTVIISPSDTLCVLDNVLINASSDIGTIFSWKKNETTIEGVTIEEYLANTSGRYKCIVTDDRTGCSDSSDVLLLTVSPPAIPISLDPSSANLCTDEILLLKANAGYDLILDTIGNGNISSATASPFKATYENSKGQYLYTASELSGLGFIPGSSISKLGFMLNGGMTTTISNLKVNIGWVQTENLTTGFKLFDKIEIIDSNMFTVQTSMGSVIFELDTPTVWDGYSSLIIETCFENNVVSVNIAVWCTSAASKCMVQSENNINDFCTFANEGIIQSLRPNLIIEHYFDAEFTWSPLDHLYFDANAFSTYNGDAIDSVYIKGVEEGQYTVSAISSLGCTSFHDFNATLTSNIVNSENDGDAYSLRKVLECIENGDSILFASGIDNVIMTDSLLINKDVHIIGSESEEISVIFNYALPRLLANDVAVIAGSGKTIYLESVTIRQLNALFTSILLKNQSTLTLNNCKFVGEQTPKIVNAGGEILVEENIYIISD